jgi:hypothetical protein
MHESQSSLSQKSSKLYSFFDIISFQVVFVFFSKEWSFLESTYNEEDTVSLPLISIGHSLDSIYKTARLFYSYCDVYATNKTSFSSDEWIY